MIETNKNELMHIQNELLGDINEVENKLNEKIRLMNQSLIEQKSIYDKKFIFLETAYNLIIQRNQSEKTKDSSKEKEISLKISSLNKQIEENSIKLELKIKDLENNLKDTTYKYDRAIADNFTIPGLIGLKAPFQSLRELIEATYKKSTESLKLKEKQAIDLKKYKEKMENIINSNKNELSIVEKKVNNYLKSQVNYIEKTTNDKFDVFEERMNILRVENGKYSFELLNKCKELKDNCDRIDDVIKKSFDDYNKEFIKYKNSFNEMNDKLAKFEENYTNLETELKTINEKLEENNKICVKYFDIENKFNLLEKSVLNMNKKYISSYFDKNESLDIARSNNLNQYLDEDEKNNQMKKINLKKIKADRKSLISKNILNHNENQISEEEDIKINNILLDSGFFGDSTKNEFSCDINGMKKAKMPFYRIRSGKILDHYPFISHDNINNTNEEKIDKMMRDDSSKYRKNCLKKKNIEKELIFPYGNHKYKYLEKKIDILGKVMVDTINKIINQINNMKRNKINNVKTGEFIETTKKEKVEVDNNNNIVIHSIKNRNEQSPLRDNKYILSDLRNSFLNSKYKKIKSKINHKVKLFRNNDELENQSNN